MHHLPAHLGLASSLALASVLTAQGDPEPTSADPVVVTATRNDADPLEVPFTAEWLDERALRRRSYRTVPQALRDIPGIMIQETAHGHGSPYIRGFTSFRNLFLIDGIRLNNSVFRPGPNQYWNTVDALSIERLEVVKGPSSVLYGSDAVGGTVQVLTRSPSRYPEEPGFAHGGRMFTRYSSAEDSIQGRGELDLGYRWENGSRTGVLVGGSAKAFGDLEGGDGVGTQRDTGYDELALDAKVEHWFDDQTRLVFAHQRVNQRDVPRTHRTVNAISWRGLSVGSDLQRDFDQDRALTYLQLHMDRPGSVIDSVHASLSWHRQDEVRHRIRGNGNQEFEGFDVNTVGASLQLGSTTSVGRLTYGFEYYHDDVDSFLRRPASPSAADAIQGPVGDDATYDLLGVYLQDQIDVTDELEITVGGRYQFAAADADSVRDPSTNTRIALDDDWDALVGSIRALYRIIPDRLHVFGGVSQGFRAPNLSDLSRFGDARTNEFEIPAPGLDPEEYIAYEIGIKAETEDLAAQASYFYTDIEDQILRFPTGNVNGSGDSEVTKANVGDGHVYGIELGAAYRVVPSTTVFGNATYMEGRISNFQNATATLEEGYLTRLMPLTLQLGVRWEETEDRFWAETAIQHVADADKLSFDDQRDTSRIPPGGTPSYTVWHARGGWNLSEATSLTVLLENITDVDYRVHGSGLNRPGRNLIFAFSTDF